MNDPLKIMDEIELERRAFFDRGAAMTLPAGRDWQSLRTALERQAEELAQARKVDSELAAEGLDYFEKSGDEGDRVYVTAIRAELAQKEARIARLEFALEHIKSLEDAGYPARLTATEILHESPAQSAAALKAEALRDVLNIIDYDYNGEECVELIDNMISRIEREAHEVNLRENREAKEES